MGFNLIECGAVSKRLSTPQKLSWAFRELPVAVRHDLNSSKFYPCLWSILVYGFMSNSETHPHIWMCSHHHSDVPSHNPACIQLIPFTLASLLPVHRARGDSKAANRRIWRWRRKFRFSCTKDIRSICSHDCQGYLRWHENDIVRRHDNGRRPRPKCTSHLTESDVKWVEMPSCLDHGGAIACFQRVQALPVAVASNHRWIQKMNCWKVQKGVEAHQNKQNDAKGIIVQQCPILSNHPLPEQHKVTGALRRRDAIQPANGLPVQRFQKGASTVQLMRFSLQHAGLP